MKSFYVLIGLLLAFSQQSNAQTRFTPEKLEALKKEIMTEVEKRHDQTAEMNDMIFSFAELGFQEWETSKYLTNILEKEGFTIEKNIAGIPNERSKQWGYLQYFFQS